MQLVYKRRTKHVSQGHPDRLSASCNRVDTVTGYVEAALDIQSIYGCSSHQSCVYMGVLVL